MTDHPEYEPLILFECPHDWRVAYQMPKMIMPLCHWCARCGLYRSLIGGPVFEKIDDAINYMPGPIPPPLRPPENSP